MEKEIMTAFATHDIDALRVIYFDANKGNVSVRAELLELTGEFIKNNSL